MRDSIIQLISGGVGGGVPMAIVGAGKKALGKPFFRD